MLKVEMLVPPAMAALWRPHLEAAFTRVGLEVALGSDFAPTEVDYVVYAPLGPDPDLSGHVRTRAVLGLWAGVERVIANRTLTQPYARMVDEGLTEGMVDWVTGHVLRHHLGLDRYIRGGAGWVQDPPPLARSRRVGILGLGALGAACARALAALKFDLAGWSRSQKHICGIACHHGAAGLEAVLARSEILVLLLPATPATDSILNAARLARMPEGAVVLNPGRGALIDDAALLAALDAGHIGHATLDTFRVEPLPQDHPYWHHPRVTVTPHIASETRPKTAARSVAENIRRVEAGLPLLNALDRARGY